MQILDLVGVLATFPRLFQCIWNLEPCFPAVIIIIFLPNSTIQLTIFLLHTFIQSVFLDVRSSRYQSSHDYLQAINYWSYLMQLSLAPNVPVEQLLWQEHYVSYQSHWQTGWSCQYNQANHPDLCSLLESLLHNLELDDVISRVELSWTS